MLEDFSPPPRKKARAQLSDQRITELMIEAAGPDGGTVGPLQVGNVNVDVLASFYKARPTTIYGGSNEIQRNILSKAVLGLPG